MSQTLACPSCGTSNPLPEDLREEAFTCVSCHAELRTAELADGASRSVDALVGWMNEAVRKPFDPASIASAPKLEDDGPAAGTFDDAERLQLDLARQVAENDALKQLVADGLDCPSCGAHNDVADDHRVQLTCTHCGATVRLSDHVAAGAVARRRLAHGVFAMRDELVAKQEAAKRRERTIVFVLVGGMVAMGVGMAALSALSALLGAWFGIG
ncbi:MAG: hypothetical protein KC621_09180 [Myxococcales bacterium]|nr:hypothetical protein [Myxococcales bacterium]